MKYSMQTASDVQRDGLGAELLNEVHNVVAEVFRCDLNNTLTFCSWGEEIPLIHIEELIRYARNNLGGFEDGNPLPEASS